MSKEKKTPVVKDDDGNRSKWGDFSIKKPAVLTLSDGTTWSGVMPEWQAEEWRGEVVFSTGMTGYVESLTDPSFAGQILVFTYPLVGNYGVDTIGAESDKIQVSGVVVSEAMTNWSHKGSDRSLIDWLEESGVPIISSVDTRALTKHLRTNGVMRGVIADKKVNLKNDENEQCFVSSSEVQLCNPNRDKTIILVDCGAKENIVRSLAQFPVRVKRVPHSYDFSEEEFAGIFISNGPGNPEAYTKLIETMGKVLHKNKPVFGICLGSQILALASGAKTYKLKFGHRGHNQPCQDTTNEKCYITSQNHGYAVDEKSLPKGWKVWFKNLNDGSVEGIIHETKPFSAVQFHPEGCPGPTDTEWLFERFIKQL